MKFKEVRCHTRLNQTGRELTGVSALCWLCEVTGRCVSLHLSSVDFLHVQVCEEPHAEKKSVSKIKEENNYI